MPTFDPPELEQTLTVAARAFRALLQEQSDSLFDNTVCPSDWCDPDGDWDPGDEPSVITPKTKLAICLPYCLRADRTCEEFLDLVAELSTSSLDRNLLCWTSKRLLLRIAPVERQAEEFFEDVLGLDSYDDGIYDVEHFPIEIPVDSQSVRCALRRGLTPFGVLIAAGEDYDKIMPPLLSYDVFVEVFFRQALDSELARNLAYAYLFEVSTSLNMDLVPAPRPVGFGDLEERDHVPTVEELRLRPLMIGKGVTEILRLYYGAINSLDAEIQVLQFYRVFEHVAGTVVHKNLVEDARMKLLSTSALDPDADFVLELKGLFELHKGFSREREAIKLTFKTCCEPTELLKVAPDFLKAVLTITPAAKIKEREEALDKFGACLVSTRNSLAHSKVNYEPTGEECPLDQLAQFVECMKVAAQQVIRWYHSQPEKLRIL